MEKNMISKELRTELEKIPCTLKDGGNFQYLSENKNGSIKMKCPECQKRGLSNIITVNIKAQKSTKPSKKKEA